jgi:hypothetical protein
MSTETGSPFTRSSLPFEDAVERAATQLGRAPYLAESRFRVKLASPRIRARDVEALLVEQQERISRP